MKNTIGMLLCASLLFSGCGKKQEVIVQQSPEYDQTVTSNENMVETKENYQNNSQYVYADAMPELEELAFIDEDNSKDSKDNAESVKVAYNENEEVCEYPLSWEDQGEDKLEFPSLRFVFDSDALVPGQEETLKQNIEKARCAAERGETIVLNAYADEFGPNDYNAALTQRRAEKMKKIYIEAGIPADKLVAAGRGQTNQLVSSEASDKATRIAELAPNRRVEIETLSTEIASA